ncbi:inactive peptidyl-prolyl cis-trans isomerase FKBP6 [Neocloeon triangulifer]|uniref:inactive peptidyl-prolyl cis-trans isomerase FKBP6 n=1 Tax=Neocloeon triangulifer TaxID=2078957 RepID=UPI00286F1319|nr:inactive peptidyl-prolyl cis-trans isomerase FKBP6 [Neocloeon triangulifer]XP_059475947.1 inactive peptidyl-prolyl cis-trans isomerase FKBP6 [Neocloeon triangulifer]XP_059475948.1 inactive peptidyl-prolyl cis-trans isomerase FKBP6 [Neocloeon triangulifer]
MDLISSKNAKTDAHQGNLISFDSFEDLNSQVDPQELHDFFHSNLAENGFKLSNLEREATGSNGVVFKTKVTDFIGEESDEGNASLDEEEEDNTRKVDSEEHLTNTKVSQSEIILGEIKNKEEKREFIPSFDELVTKMFPVRDDKKLMKRVMNEGNGEKVVDDALVKFSIDAYLDKSDEPFDSSKLRQTPMKSRMGEGTLFQGLEEAIMTMEKNEKAQFLLHPDLAFGANGCPPRIPGNAYLMYEITVDDIMEGKVADLMQTRNNANADFPTVLKVVLKEHAEGVEYFKNQSYRSAIISFRSALRRLEKCEKIKNEDESKEQMKNLLKIFVNLAVCHNSPPVNEPEKACVMCQEALKIDPKNCKANFHYGKALASLGDYDGAQRKLLRAKDINPYDETINLELAKVHDKKIRSATKEKEMAQNMFQTASPNQRAGNKDISADGHSLKENDHEQFKVQMRKRIERFISNKNQKQLELPIVLSEKEYVTLQELAHEKHLSFSTRGCNHYVISKSD